MIRLIAIIFGILFIFFGVAGFTPAFNTNSAIFGIFEVGTIHNLVYIATGVLAIMAATNLRLTKHYFLIVGILYAAMAIVGFIRDGNLFIMRVNMADNFLHLGIGLVSIYLAYYANQQQMA